MPPLVLDGTNGVSGVDGTASNPAIEGTDSNTGIFYPAADTVAIGTGGTERLRVDSAGNAGLGVTPSAWSGVKAIEIASAGSGIYSFGATDVRVTGNSYWNGSAYKYGNTNLASMYVQNSGVHYWYIAPSGTAGNTITWTQAMTLDASGQLMVGTTTAADALTISSSDTDTRIYIQASDTGTGNANGYMLGTISSIGYVWNYENQPIIFGTNNTERARITSGGDFFLATGSQSLGMNQYTYKKWFKFDYPASGFGAGNDCTEFYTAGAGAADANVQARLTLLGNFGIRGTLSQSQSFDYAEFFEWGDGNIDNEDRVGYSVVLVENKIRKATAEDSSSAIIGVISGTAGVILNAALFEWQGAHLRDEFGRIIYDKVNRVFWKDEDGTDHNYIDDQVPEGVVVPETAQRRTYNEPRINPEFDPEAHYEDRGSRPEWGVVGLVGQVRIRKGQPVNDRWIKMRDVSATVEEWMIR